MVSGNKGYSLSALGVVNTLGRGKADVWDALMRGTWDHFTPWRHPVGERTVLVGAVAGALPEVPGKLAHHDSRNNRLALAALDEVHAEVQAAIDEFGAHRIGVVLGSSTSGIAEGDYALEAYDRDAAWPKQYHLVQQELGDTSRFLAEHLGITGPAYTISTACSSSAKAFTSARNMIETGLCDAVLTGGVDSLCRLTVAGFSALEAVSSSRCNSMSRNRDGLLIGEAAALFLMDRSGRGPQLLGVGESSDAYHMSAPDPEGNGAAAAMELALSDAGLAPADVAYVNLHGTATPHNDAMESQAVARVFGLDTPCSSTKPLTGHTLGAAGATEAAFCWMMLSFANEQIQFPPHCFDGERDPELPALHLVQTEEAAAWPGSGAVLSNSFAFGGNNCSLVLGVTP